MTRRSPSAVSESKPVNIKVLAEYLSLSPTTISLVMNDAPAGRSIPEPTRERVREAAKKLGYRPSFFARSLRKKQSFTIGTMVPEISDPYSTMIMSGVDDVMQEEGYLDFTVSHRRKPDLIDEYPRILLDRSVEGIIVVDTPLLHALPVPTVSIGGHQVLEGITNVILDHRRAAELVLRYLHKLGHRDFAYIRGQEHSSDSRVRWQNLMDVSRELGLRHVPELTSQLEIDSPSPELGYPVVGRMLATGLPFTALVCYNDFAAIGAIRALMDAGLHVPEDVSVVGFDDVQNAAFNNPSLTTIRQPLREMGRLAARALLRRIREPELPVADIPVRPELLIRESTLQPRQKTIAAIASSLSTR